MQRLDAPRLPNNFKGWFSLTQHNLSGWRREASGPYDI